MESKAADRSPDRIADRTSTVDSIDGDGIRDELSRVQAMLEEALASKDEQAEEIVILRLEAEENAQMLSDMRGALERASAENAQVRLLLRYRTAISLSRCSVVGGTLANLAG